MTCSFLGYSHKDQDIGNVKATSNMKIQQLTHEKTWKGSVLMSSGLIGYVVINIHNLIKLGVD